mgnify:CR=1 FL=1
MTDPPSDVASRRSQSELLSDRDGDSQSELLNDRDGEDEVVQTTDGEVRPADEADDLYVLVGVFIHWEAADDAKIQQYNYEATKLSIQRAVNGEPKAATVTEQRNSAQHPFAAN